MDVQEWKRIFINDISKNIKIEIRDNGSLSKISYINDDKKHNCSGPAIVKWYVGGNKEQEVYYIDNERNDLILFDKIIIPARTEFHKNGNKELEEYYTHGVLTNPPVIDNEIIPACKYWFKNGNKLSEKHYINGMVDNIVINSLTNEMIPAMTFWNIHGIKVMEQYFDKNRLINTKYF